MSESDSRRKRAMSAAEFVDQLKSDPAYVSRMRDLETRRRVAIAEHREASRPVTEALADVGIRVESLDELRRSGRPYSAAVPVLLEWLATVANHGVRESIVRTLSVPWAAPAAIRPMVEAFRNENHDGVRWAMGNALSIIADASVFEEVTALALDVRYGTSRQMLAYALARMKTARAIPVLIEMLKDADVQGHAVDALGKMRAREARPLIEPFLRHEKTWIRNAAKKAIERIDKARE